VILQIFIKLTVKSYNIGVKTAQGFVGLLSLGVKYVIFLCMNNNYREKGRAHGPQSEADYG
jgi:hypothetical protein